MQTSDRKAIWALAFALIFVGLTILATHFPVTSAGAVGSLVSIGAAFIGGWFITRQISASDRQLQRQRDAKFLAARAAMPLTLAAVSRYASECVRQLDKIYEMNGGCTPLVKNLTFPEFPDAAISEFRALIEYGSPSIQTTIAGLLQRIQVQRSRLEHLEVWNARKDDSYIVTTMELENHIIDAVEVYARAEHLYEYGRFTSSLPRPLDAKAISKELNLLVMRPTYELSEKAKAWKLALDPDFTLIHEVRP